MAEFDDEDELEDGAVPVMDDEEEDAPDGTIAEEDAEEVDEEDLAKHGMREDDEDAPVADF